MTVNNRTNPFWSAISHSISSFCTAGFSLYNNSFENYANDLALNIVFGVLSILGAIGYIVMVDVWFLIREKKIAFTSKVILNMTFWLLLIGAN
jgi:trk system potassium uptake protein TrkH